MTPRLFSPLASAALVAFYASPTLAEPPPSPPAPSASVAPAPGFSAPPYAPSVGQSPWMQRPTPYPGWRLEEDAPSPEKGKRQWYGGYSLLGLIPSDLVFVLGSFLAFDHDTTEVGVGMMLTGAAGHCLSAPIAHWVHGNIGRGFLSLGLNVGTPLLGVVIANGTDGGDIVVPLVALSVIAWPIIDIAALSYADPPDPKRRNARVFESLSVLPMIDGDKKVLSLVGQF